MQKRKRRMSTAEARLAVSSYYACASHVDSQLGRLLGALETTRLAPTTALVVHADHGFSLGRHGRWSKYALYEEVTRVPLLIAVPGLRQGVTANELVEGIDLLPTLLDLWGVRRADPPSLGAVPGGARFRLGGKAVSLDGDSLLPLLLHEAPETVHGTAHGTAPGDGLGGAPVGEAALSGAPSRARAVSGDEAALSGAPSRARVVSGDEAALSGALWPKWYVRSELHEGFRRNLVEEPLAFRRNFVEESLAGAAAVTEKSWRGVQLYVRTYRYAYTLFLKLDPDNQTDPNFKAAATRWEAGTYRLVDETLYDLELDPGEANNVVYDGEQAETRGRLLELCLRDWGVRLRGPRATSRRVRAKYLVALAKGAS